MTRTSINSPRVEGKIKLWVPHKDREIAFAFPSLSGVYNRVGRQILQGGQIVPTGDITASLLHAAYGCFPQAKRTMGQQEFKDIRNTAILLVFNRNLWTDQGIYSAQDPEAIGRLESLNVRKLEEALKDGRELSWGGIRISKDGSVGFAPKGSYTLGEIPFEKVAKDGVIVITYGQEGAKKIGEVVSTFRNAPINQGFDVEEGQTPEEGLSLIRKYKNHLNFISYLPECVSYDGRAFGGIELVAKPHAKIKQDKLFI